MLKMNKYICLALCLSIAYTISICPKGQQKYVKTISLSKESMKFKSEGLEAFYSIEKNSTKYALKGYKIQTFQTGSSSTFDIVQFQKTAQSTWEIVSVSKKGNCVGVLISSDMFIAFSTGANTFIETQNISTKNYLSKKFQIDDECSTIHVKHSQNGDQRIKIFQNSQQTNQSLKYASTIFDPTFKYAINSIGEFLIFQNGNYISKLTNSTLIKPNLLSINYNQQNNAIIIITKDDLGTYSLFIINPQKLTNFYNKVFTKNDYNNGGLKFDIKQEGNFIIVKDSLELKYCLEVTNLIGKLNFDQYNLQKTQYKTLFNQKSPVSVSDNIIFVYKNKKVYHFTFYQKVIYFLGVMDSAIEENNRKDSLKENELKLKRGFTYFLPTKLQSCTVIASNSSSDNSSSTNEFQQLETPPQALDSNGNVAKCDANCLSCQIGGKCKICSSGYALKSSQCLPCDNCRVCSPDNTSFCYQCYSPYMLDQMSGVCIKPACTDPNCFQCSLNKQCTLCKPGYSLLSSQCTKCSVLGCTSCSINSTVCDANSCQQGYIYYTNIQTDQTICQDCAAGCRGCSPTDISSCTSCVAGFYLQKDPQSDTAQRCYNCLQNCKQCINKTQCVKCITGMKLSQDKKSCLAKCSQNCLTCDSTDPNKCLSCYSGSKLDQNNSICLSDFSCNETHVCASCSLGYVIYNSYCYKCTYQDAHCVGCNYPKTSVCSKCQTGYYLHSQTCTKCFDECSACVSEFSCSSCVSGYYLSTKDSNPTGICLKCSSQCKSCKITPNMCTQCQLDYHLANTKCISDNFVQLIMTLNIPLQNLISITSKVAQWIVKAANKYRDSSTPQYTIKDFILQKTSKGSSIVSGALSTKSGSGTNSVAEGLGEQMNSKPIIGGYAMIGSSIKANIPTTTLLLNQHQSSSLALILGISLPLGLLVVIGIIIITVKISARKKQLYADRGGKSDSQAETVDYFSRGSINKVDEII